MAPLWKRKAYVDAYIAMIDNKIIHKYGVFFQHI